MVKLIRYSQENRNSAEAFKGKWGFEGMETMCVTVMKNLVFVNAHKGAKVTGYKLPEVYDGFLICSDGSTVEVNDSTINLSLADNVSAQGVLKLLSDN
jgi:hypothetical protein